MVSKLIELSLKIRGLIIVAIIALIMFGVYQYTNMPVDAFPDISPIMVPVFAEAHGMAPEEIERLITFPIEAAMNGLPNVMQIKSTSAFGMAVVYIYFKDNVDIYFARQLVGQRLTSAMADLPDMHETPILGPISTGLGQIFLYYLALDDGADTEGKAPNTYLREINDWIVKFQLQTVPGVTDILSIGGHVLQYQIRINPYALQKHTIALEDLIVAVKENNRNAGGQFLVLGSEEHLVRGIGLVEDLETIRDIPVKVVNGVPVKVGDVAEVQYGNEIRRGAVTRNGSHEVVSGLVLKLFGENTSEVIEHLYKKVEEVQASLPEGVSLVPYYEQAELVEQATWTVKKALIEGAFLVILVLILFLGNIRAAFIVAISLPFCALTSIIAMNIMGISANLMSMGGIAIAIGMLVDGSIVMVENIFRHLGSSDKKGKEKIALIISAAKEVSRPIVFSLSIVIVVFLPILTLQGIEGKMFSPMALTMTFAVFGSIVFAILVSPVLSYFLISHSRHEENRLVNKLKGVYVSILEKVIHHKGIVITAAAVVFLASLAMIPFIGTEFVPTLEEGSILIGVTMPPSISLEKGVEKVMILERRIMRHDEVTEVVSRIGRPEAGSHPHPVNYAEIQIELKPFSEWTVHKNKADFIETLNRELSDYPGITLNFTQPIQNAFDELLSGIKAQVAIKLFGEDLEILREKSSEIHHAVEDVEGLVDLSIEQSFGQPQVQIIADRKACSRYGITVNQILELVEVAIGGEVIDNIYLNIRRFDIHLRYQETFRKDPSSIGSLLVHTDNGSLIPLSQVAEVKQVVGPVQINREKNQRRWIIQGNVRGRDLGGVISDIRRRVREDVVLPPGYFVEYGGQFENQQRAMKRLAIIIPVVLVTIFLLLWVSFDSLLHALIILINVPFAMIGGIFGLIITGEYLSVPAAVGFIALFGMAMQDGVVLLSCFNQLRCTGKSVNVCTLEGGMLRLRPVLVTTITTLLGLFPLLLSKGIGSEVQRPLAVVVVLGLSSSTILTLFVLPAVYCWLEQGRKPPVMR